MTTWRHTQLAAIATLCGSFALAGAAHAAAGATTDTGGMSDVRVLVTPEGAIHAGDLVFDSWPEYFQSDFFIEHGKRCGTVTLEGVPDAEGLIAGQGDCTYNYTNPADEYDPAEVTFRIPVVVHVITMTSGYGNVPDSLVLSQMEILNEDFLALPGTNGEDGTDVQIEFYLATEDPDGNPTNGITRTANNTWFNDAGGYYNTLAWDPHRYLNIYTNSASGALGYVPFLPQNGPIGANSDRVVVLWSTFGRNAPYGHPYNLGRTTTHEVGHYLGLFHTFQNGCTNSNCYTYNDRICDTNPESSPNYSCPPSRVTCGSTDPIHNYLDYSYDYCMWEFTPEQARRMRCTLEYWRLNLFEVVINCPADLTGDGTVNAADLAILLGNWGVCHNCPGDFDDNDIIDSGDLAVLLGSWGDCD